MKKEKKEIEVNSLEEAQAKIAELQKDSSLNKPKPEEIEAVLQEFEDAKKDFEAKKFEIGTPEQADAIYDFMIRFMEKFVYWTKNGWMGVIRMHAELTEAKKNKKEGDRFGVGYQALEFMFFALTNPGGSGIESAREIEQVADLYAELIELSGKAVEKSREELKEVQWIGDKAAAMSQGFYLEREDGTPKEEGKGQFKSPSAADLLRKKE